MKIRDSRHNDRIILYSALVFAFVFFFYGCANQKLAENQSRISRMSDRELTDRYHEVVERLDDMDRDAENAKTREREIQSPDSTNQRENPGDVLHHMHIGDTWYQFRQEKKMLLKELGKRGIDP